MPRLRYQMEYAGVRLLAGAIRRMPYSWISPMARCAGYLVLPVYPLPRLVKANLRAAMPELPPREVNRICRESFYHLFRNMFEFVWLRGDPERVRRCYHLPEPIVEKLKRHIAAGERIIFINPHLGSWEASGVMAPFYTGMDMAAIAKPVRNPYLNRMLNTEGREKIKGLRIIFSSGAARTAIKLMRQGESLGTLIDQNTRVRDGGEFLNFFGLPVASSVSPAVLKRYCDAHGIPAVLLFGTSLRLADGRIHAFCEDLPRPFDSYPDDRAVIQDVMNMSESYIRRYPEQYLWLYKRFQYIPPDCPEELLQRYPYYAARPKPSFFHRKGGERSGQYAHSAARGKRRCIRPCTGDRK